MIRQLATMRPLPIRPIGGTHPTPATPPTPRTPGKMHPLPMPHPASDAVSATGDAAIGALLARLGIDPADSAVFDPTA